MKEGEGRVCISGRKQCEKLWAWGQDKGAAYVAQLGWYTREVIEDRRESRLGQIAMVSTSIKRYD